MNEAAQSSSGHKDRCESPQILVSPAARAAIADLTAEHGELMFHLTDGCCDSRSPLCLRATDLSLGPRDVLIGHADGIPVYEMASSPGGHCAPSYRLEVVDGVPVGFSLPPGHMKRFVFRQING